MHTYIHIYAHIQILQKLQVKNKNKKITKFKNVR